MKILKALSLLLLFALPAAADCLKDTKKEELPQCRGTVMIRTPSESGAGIAIGEADDGIFVLTARHIVETAQSIEVTFYDKKYTSFPARLEQDKKFNDKAVDLAVVKVFASSSERLPRNLPKLVVREDVRPDEDIFIVGYRDGRAWQRDRTVIRGGDEGGDQRKFLYDSENLKRGSSGGPVFDKDGYLLGIVYDQSTGNDGGALKISQFWTLLHAMWGVTSLLTKRAEPLIPAPTPTPTGANSPSNAPTINVELKTINILTNRGKRLAGWSYQVFLVEEENLSEDQPLFNNIIPTPPDDTRTPFAFVVNGNKTKKLTREDRIVIKIVMTGPDARHRLERQAPLDFSKSINLAVALTPLPSASAGGSPKGATRRGAQLAGAPAPAQENIKFYFSLTKVRVIHKMPKAPLIKEIEMGIGDLNGLMEQGKKIEGEGDLNTLRRYFDDWRTRCGITLDALDRAVRDAKWDLIMRDRKGQPITFKGGFDEALEMSSSDDSNNLQRDEVLMKVRDSIRYLNTAIWILRDKSSPEPFVRPGTMDAPQTPPASGTEQPPWHQLSGAGPLSRRSTAAPNSLAGR